MRVAILAPPWFSVPPTAYGGIESVVHLLVEGLVEAGVDTTLFAAGSSQTSARLVAPHREAPTEDLGRTTPELRHALACVTRADEFDLVHDHSGPLGLALLGGSSTPMVHTVHGPLDDPHGELVRAATELAGQRRTLISISRRQQELAPELPWLANVPNAIDVDGHPFGERPEESLAFLGRMSPDKGLHSAIAIARAVGLPLRIAAKCRDHEEHVYFEQVIRPLLGDGIEYLGELEHPEKIELLRSSAALLFPIEWEEPFGLVMVEAMACGTPVVATRRGAVPEVVTDGVSGLIGDGPEALAALVPSALDLDRAAVRADAVRRFSPARMVAGYLFAYRAALERHRPHMASARLVGAQGAD